MWMLLSNPRVVCSFGIQPSVDIGVRPRLATTRLLKQLAASNNDDNANMGENNECNDDKPRTNKEDEKFRKALDSRVNAIQVEKTREQLEQAHTQAFLKRKPRKLPYKDARIWVQANLGCDTEEEFMDLVANGNLRTPYIPKQPEKYYTETREWISWEHFLRGCFDNRKVSAVKPSTGIFD